MATLSLVKKKKKKKRACSTELLKWAKIPKIRLSRVFFFYYILWPGSFGFYWFLKALCNCYWSCSYMQHRPCPPNTLLVKVKDPWRSAPQLVRGPRATWAARVVLWLESRLHFSSSPAPYATVWRVWNDVEACPLRLGQNGFYTAHTRDLMNTFFNQTFIYSSCICYGDLICEVPTGLLEMQAQ